MRTLACSLALLLAACGSSTASSSSGSSSSSGASSSTASGSSGSGSTGASSSSGSTSDSSSSSSSSGGTTGGVVDAGCYTARDPDATRAVVISLPFRADGGPNTTFELLELDASGQITAPGAKFEMNGAAQGKIAFTPNGRTGYVAQDDGTLGIFDVADDAGVTVVQAGLQAGFYARQLIVSPDGTTLYAIDEDTLDNGGGLFSMPIACDGTLGSATKLGTFNTPNAFALLDATPRFAISGGAIPDAGNQDDFYVADPSGAVLGQTALFSTHDAIASAVATMSGYALVADDGYFAGSRVAVGRLDASGPVAVDVLSTPNPADVVASPFGNSALVLNSDGQDALTRLSFDPSNTAHPFALAGHLTYVAAHPQLPAEAIVLNRGALTGRVLIGELSGVRQVQFEPDGGIADLSLFVTGPDLTDIVGALGVQP